jgi:hypothetical protein
MSIPSAWPQVLDFFGTPLVIEPALGQLSSDAGLLPVLRLIVGAAPPLGSVNAVYLRDGATGKLLAAVLPPPDEGYYLDRLGAIALFPPGDLLALSRGTWLKKQNPYDLIVWDVKQGRPRAVNRRSSESCSR